MDEYLVWLDGDDPLYMAHIIQAWDEEDAATTGADEIYSDSAGEAFGGSHDYTIVCVYKGAVAAEIEMEEVKRFKVHMDWSPNFYAIEMKK